MISTSLIAFFCRQTMKQRESSRLMIVFFYLAFSFVNQMIDHPYPKAVESV